MTPVAGPPAIVRLRLLGEELTLRTDQDPADLERLAAELDARLTRLAAELNLSAQPTRLALLAGLQLAEELRDARGRHDRYARDTEAAAAAMVARIEQALRYDEP